LNQLAGEVGCVLVEDRELLEENTFLMEYPEALLGSFDETFLTLPDVVISTALKQHQRYFSLQDPTGALLPRFVAPLNNRAETAEAVRPGMERVVRARLKDALFYYQEDMQIPLEDRVERLKGIVWVEGLGTLYDKTQRMLNLVEVLLEEIPNVHPEIVRTATRLAKTDQTTLMIRDGKEFTKLEGRIGMEYALRQGYPEPVARAIYEHLLPRAPGDSLPRSAEGALIGVADRLDTLAGLFHKGERPSGSEDPFGLRRIAATLLDLLFGFRFPVDLEDMISRALQAYNATDSSRKALIHFMEERLERYLEERERIRYDLVDAALVHGLSSILDVYERARALQYLLDTDPEQFQMMAVGQKRLANILKDLDDPGKVDPSRFQEKAEKVLHETLMQTRPVLDAALSRRAYTQVLALLRELRPVIDRFFDEVFVMVDDPEIRRNRLALLKEVRSLFLSFADFSRIVVSGATGT
jgi:glycyl-tRNA synthetase beta chain